VLEAREGGDREIMRQQSQSSSLQRRRRRVSSSPDQRLQRIIEHVADAIVVVDRDGQVEFANPAAEQLLGRPSSQLIGSQFGFPVAGVETTELDVVGGRAAEMRVVELSWGGKPAWLASLRDVTDRREAEQAARRLWRERTAREEAEKERRRLQDLLQRAPAGILTTRGTAHVCAFVNPVMLKLAANRPLSERPLAEALPELAGHRFLSAFDDAYRLGVSQSESELEIDLAAAAEGGHRVLDVCWEPLVGDDGRVEGVMCFAHDVTEQVVLLRDLEKAMQRLREDERQKDHFMAMLGHELRNPLAGIDGGLRLLEHGADPQQARWAVSMMRKQVGQLTTLLDDLLDVARIARGKLELQRRLVALRDLIESVAAGATSRLREHGQELEVTLPDRDVVIDGDSARLEQVLSNLLANASRYSGTATRIVLRAYCQPGQAVLEVIDQGVGIEPEMREKIFEPFVQGTNGATRAGGLGIGLTLVKQLVELHGGSVAAASAGRGQGSTFTVRLPLAEASLEALPVATEAAAPEPIPPCRVLIVDDNQDAGRALAELLELWGCETYTATDGASGLAAARHVRPDVVLLDLDLPDVTGYEVAERLRRDAELEGLLILAVSGFGDELARERSRRSGIDHHLVKPVEVEALMRLIAARDEDG
jgi:signal transduction histidine kinase/ActR/RegA family two-component response regulator